MSTTTPAAPRQEPLWRRIVEAFRAARRPAQPAWLRDTPDEDLFKVGLTRGALLAAIPAQRGVF